MNRYRMKRHFDGTDQDQNQSILAVDQAIGGEELTVTRASGRRAAVVARRTISMSISVKDDLAR